MKRFVGFSILLVFMTLLQIGATDQTSSLTDAELARVNGTGWCGFFSGLATGLGTGAMIVGFVPGGQGFAVGAGATAALIGAGVQLAC